MGKEILAIFWARKRTEEDLLNIHSYASDSEPNRWLFSHSSVRHIIPFWFRLEVYPFLSSVLFILFRVVCNSSFISDALFVIVFTTEISIDIWLRMPCNNTRYTFYIHGNGITCWKCNFVHKIKRIELSLSFVLCATDPLRWYRFAT